MKKNEVRFQQRKNRRDKQEEKKGRTEKKKEKENIKRCLKKEAKIFFSKKNATRKNQNKNIEKRGTFFFKLRFF